ncbi:hypothetical protein BMS3Bbin07_00896 [bacterium BMS3Bbin07]|nr:hypothetical protein BMS3Bbin07_00896 [bacterium BMS3Bbin07]
MIIIDEATIMSGLIPSSVIDSKSTDSPIAASAVAREKRLMGAEMSESQPSLKMFTTTARRTKTAMNQGI